jgi:hypothetical protein
MTQNLQETSRSTIHGLDGAFQNLEFPDSVDFDPRLTLIIRHKAGYPCRAGVPGIVGYSS